MVPGRSLALPRVAAQSLQALPQPLACRAFRLARAGHPVRASGQAATAASTLDELLGRTLQAAAAGMLVLALQVLARGSGLVPAAVALEAAAGVAQRRDQGADFGIAAGIGQRGWHQGQGQQAGAGPCPSGGTARGPREVLGEVGMAGGAHGRLPGMARSLAGRRRATGLSPAAPPASAGSPPAPRA